MAATTQSKSKNTPRMRADAINYPDVNDLVLKDRYDEAIALAKKELKQIRHWYLAHICEAYYEKRKYKTALKWGEKAMKANSHCPTVLWYHAGPLFMLGNVKEAIKCYRSIYDRGLNSLAYGVCSESKEDALRVRSDCRIHLAVCYYAINDLANALKWSKLFLRYFHNGGLEKRKFGEKLVIRYKKEIEDERKSRKIK